MRIVAFSFKCSGCHICEQACAFQHFNVQNFAKARLRVRTIVEPGKAVYHVINLCRQCEDPPCVKSCPTGALYRTEGGIIRLDESRCTGCMECARACPYGAVFSHPEITFPLICDMCYPEEPACIRFCPMNALQVKEG